MRTGCRGQCFAHAAACALPAARLARNAAVRCVSCCVSHVLASSCMPSVVCCLLSVACCPLPVVCRRPACCLLSLALLHVCCPVHAVCCLFRVVYTKPGSYCMRTLPGVRCMLSVALHVVVARCMFHEVRRVLPVRRCTLFVTCCMSSAAWRMLSGCCAVARCVSSVAFSPLRVA